MTDGAVQPNVTIVTAFFDLGREEWQESTRTVDGYFTWFSNLLELRNPIVIYTSPDLVKRVEECHNQAGLRQTIHIVAVDDFRAGQEDLLGALQQTMAPPELQAFFALPGITAHTRPDYVLLNALKAEFVVRAIEQGLVETVLAAWVDFGYVRHREGLPVAPHLHLDMDSDHMHVFSLWRLDLARPMFDIMRRCDRFVFGGVVVGGVDAWRRLAPLWRKMMWSILACGIADDDQMALLMAVREEPDLFEVRQSDWFDVLRNFGVPTADRTLGMSEVEGQQDER